VLIGKPKGYCIALDAPLPPVNTFRKSHAVLEKRGSEDVILYPPMVFLFEGKKWHIQLVKRQNY
jgi:hypothetical protein